MPRGSTNKRNLLQIALQVSEPQDEWLAEVSHSLGISKQELIRRILDEHRGATPSGWKTENGS